MRINSRINGFEYCIELDIDRANELSRLDKQRHSGYCRAYFPIHHKLIGSVLQDQKTGMKYCVTHAIIHYNSGYSCVLCTVNETGVRNMINYSHKLFCPTKRDEWFAKPLQFTQFMLVTESIDKVFAPDVVSSINHVISTEKQFFALYKREAEYAQRLFP